MAAQEGADLMRVEMIAVAHLEREILGRMRSHARVGEPRRLALIRRGHRWAVVDLLEVDDPA